MRKLNAKDGIVNDKGRLMKIQVTPSYTCGTITRKEPIIGEMSEQQYIDKHNEYVDKCVMANITTKAKRWDDLEEDKKQRLLPYRFKQILGYEEREITIPQYLNGYYYNSPDGGNNSQGWVKLFHPSSLKIVNPEDVPLEVIYPSEASSCD